MKTKYCASARFSDGTIKADDVFAESETEAIALFTGSKEVQQFLASGDGIELLSTKAVPTC